MIILENLRYLDFEILHYESNNAILGMVTGSAAILKPSELAIPGFKHVSLIFGNATQEEGPALFGFELLLGVRKKETPDFDIQNYLGPFTLRLPDIHALLRFSREIFIPVEMNEGEASFKLSEDENEFVECDVLLNLVFSTETGFTLGLAQEITLSHSHFMIGQTGIIVAIEPLEESVQIDMNETGIMMKNITVWPFGGKLFTDEIPKQFDPKIQCKELTIGKDGLSALIEFEQEPEETKTFSLRGFEIEFKNNLLTRGAIKAHLNLSKLSESSILADFISFEEIPLKLWVDFQISYDPTKTFPESLGFAATIAPVQPEGVNVENGMVTLSASKNSPLKSIVIQKLGVQLTAGSTLALLLDTLFNLELKSDGLKLNAPLPLVFKNQKIQIVPEIEFDPGHIQNFWTELPQEQSMSFGPFKATFSKVGFGQENGLKWLGLNIEKIQLPLGFAMEGSVRGLRLYYEKLSTIKDFSLEGLGLKFSLEEIIDFSGLFSYEKKGKCIMGEVESALPTLGLRLAGDLVVSDSNFYFKLNSQFSGGIPLFGTGASLYGLLGLFGYNYTPKLKSPFQDYYNNWYKPSMDLSSLKHWDSHSGSIAIGLGALIGTTFDSGTSVNANCVLLVLHPGPVILIVGKGNLLGPEPNIKEEGLLNVMMVIDRKIGLLSVHMDASWGIDKLVKVMAQAEARFSFSTPSNWHLYIGQCFPKEKRINASALNLFEASAFLMIEGKTLSCNEFQIDGPALVLGLEAGRRFSIDWDIISVKLEAWFRAMAAMGFDPTIFVGFIQVDGRLGVEAFGFGFDLGIAAKLKVLAPDPYFIQGSLHVELGLPWPLPDVDETIDLMWGKETKPPTPQINIGITALHRWQNKSYTKTIPMDAMLLISFNHPMNDSTKYNLAGKMFNYEEKVGDKYIFSYDIENIEIYEKGGLDNKKIVGFWQNYNGAKNNRLLLFAETPLDYLYTMDVSKTYFEDAEYPCVTVKPSFTTCINFDALKLQILIAPISLSSNAMISSSPGYSEEYVKFLADIHLEGKSSQPAYQSHAPAKIEVHPYSFVDEGAISGSKALRLPWVMGTTPGIVIQIEPSTNVDIWFHKMGAFSIICEFKQGQETLKTLTKGDVIKFYQPQGGYKETIEKYSYESSDKIITHIVVHTGGVVDIKMFRAGWLLRFCFLSVPQKPVLDSNSFVTVLKEQAIKGNLANDKVLAQADKFLFLPKSKYEIKVSAKHHVTDIEGEEKSETQDATMHVTVTGPPEDLTPYIEATWPQNGSGMVYYGYDLKILYKKFYVLRMYQLDGDELQILIMDKSGNELKSEKTKSVLTIPLTMDKAQVIWGSLVEKAPCISEEYYPMSALLSSVTATFDPKTSYIVQIRRKKEGGPLYQFQFTTGQYRGFLEQINSFNKEQALKVNQGEPPKAFVSCDPFDIEVESLPEDWKERVDKAIENQRWQEIWYNIFKQPYKPSPERPEINILWGEFLPYAFFIDSPERFFYPLRTQLEFFQGNSKFEIKMLPSEDGTRVFIFRNEFNPFKPGSYKFKFVYKVKISKYLELTRDGKNADEIGYVTFKVPEKPLKYT